jgi:hypothetical protein
VKVNDQEIRLADLPLRAVLAIQADSPKDKNDRPVWTGSEIVIALQVAPLADPGLAIKVAEQCAVVAGVADPAAWVEERLAESWLAFSELFVDVQPDLPEVGAAGPFVEGVPSTTGS